MIIWGIATKKRDKFAFLYVFGYTHIRFYFKVFSIMKKFLFSLLFWVFGLGAGLLFVNNATYAAPNLGININKDCMLGVGCSFDIQKVLGLKKDTGNEERTSVLLFVQDVILAATMFIWTVVTIVLIWCGVLFIWAGRKGDASLQKKATQGIINAVIGLALVSFSYGIVQLIRYIAST